MALECEQARYWVLDPPLIKFLVTGNHIRHKGTLFATEPTQIGAGHSLCGFEY